VSIGEPSTIGRTNSTNELRWTCNFFVRRDNMYSRATRIWTPKKYVVTCNRLY
jgi:hypothetical protein